MRSWERAMSPERMNLENTHLQIACKNEQEKRKETPDKKQNNT